MLTPTRSPVPDPVVDDFHRVRTAVKVGHVAQSCSCISVEQVSLT